MQRKFLSGGGISEIYPSSEGAVDSRVRPDHRDYSLGYLDRGAVGLVCHQKPVQHGGGRHRVWHDGRELLRAGGHPRP